MCRGQKTTCWSKFSLSTMWVFVVQLWPSGLTASAFTLLSYLTGSCCNFINYPRSFPQSIIEEAQDVKEHSYCPTTLLLQVGKLRPGQGRTLTLEKSKTLNQLQRRKVFPVHKTMKKRKKVYMNLPERREERCPHPTCLSRAGSFQDSARS